MLEAALETLPDAGYDYSTGIEEFLQSPPFRQKVELEATDGAPGCDNIRLVSHARTRLWKEDTYSWATMSSNL